MSLKAAGDLALDSVRAALLVMRWSLGMMLLGALGSAVAAALLLDEAVLWVRSGLWGKLATLVLIVALLILPWIWSWLGRAYGIRKAVLLLLGGRAEVALAYLLRAVAKARGGTDAADRGLSPQGLIEALRKPSMLSGPARWLAWLIRWQLDLDRSEAHLQQAHARALADGTAPELALAQALRADLGERWLEADASTLWALAAAQVLLVGVLAWLW